ncbi:MAG: VCBS repeat-containing protein [Bacteroidales bacterium]|nr:VCBS repeat-containing protein [Bacteroidales bacterium]
MTLDPLETRTVPAAGIATVREIASASVSDVATVRDQFRTDLGDTRREITWDGVATNQADPNTLPGNAFAGQGLRLTTTGTGFKVSGDPAVVGNAASQFGSINTTYRTAFQQSFTTPRLFTPIGSNITTINFVVPGSDTPATVRGFGAVFSDVDTAAGAKIEFFDVDGNLIFSRAVPHLSGNGNLSFLGASFDTASIATVRITSGEAAIAASVDDITQGGKADLVVMDDFVYGEPGSITPPPTPIPGVFLAGVGAGSSPLATAYQGTGQAIGNFTAFTPAFTGGVRVAAADMNNDGVTDYVFGSGPGMSSQVRVIDGKTGAQLANIAPFESTFTGGVYVAAGDLNGDGIGELVITPDEGGGPRVQIYNGFTFTKIADFFGIDDAAFRGGVRPALGNINSDKTADLVVAAGYGGGPRVAIYDGTTLFAGRQPLKLVSDFFVFEPTLRDGVYVAVGDINSDGYGDLIFGGGPQGGPRVLILSGDVVLQQGGYSPVSSASSNAVLANFFSGNPDTRGGIRVAAHDINGDNIADVLTGDGAGVGTTVRGYLGQTIAPGITPPLAMEFAAFPGLATGVYVG